MNLVEAFLVLKEAAANWAEYLDYRDAEESASIDAALTLAPQIKAMLSELPQEVL